MKEMARPDPQHRPSAHAVSFCLSLSALRGGGLLCPVPKSRVSDSAPGKCRAGLFSCRDLEALLFHLRCDCGFSRTDDLILSWCCGAYQPSLPNGRIYRWALECSALRICSFSFLCRF